jgi:hypothetical protein
MLDFRSAPKYGMPVISWQKDGVLLNLDNRIQKVQNGSLFFRRVQHKKKKNISDEGMYECLVQNNIGSIIARRVPLFFSFEETSTPPLFFNHS